MMFVDSGRLANTLVVEVEAQLIVNHFSCELERDSQTIQCISEGNVMIGSILLRSQTTLINCF